MDVLKQEWVTDHSSSPNVISYMHEKMEAMSEHMQKNLQKARLRQKAWYDQRARTFFPVWGTSTHSVAYS